MAFETLSLSSSSSSSLFPFFTKPTLPNPPLIKSNCFFSKSTFSLYITNRIDRWTNPDRKKRYVNPPNINRPWVQSDSLPPHDSKERIKVVSYNILGDRNAIKHKGLYSNVPSDYMDWDYRKKIICEELIGLDPDIICLQEVDKYFDLSIIMEKEGYVGTYKRRTGEATDGCAMFWKANVFRKLEGESIRFNEFGLRDNVAQLSVLEMCEADSRRILVGNIHVLFNQSRGDIKLGQIRLFLSKAHALSEKWGNIPIVLAGDFNSTPQSAIYEFLSSSELNITLYDRKDLSGQRNCHPAQFGDTKRQIEKPCILTDSLFEYSWTDEEVTTATGDPTKTVIQHPLKLRSSYATVTGSKMTRDSFGEPLVTSYHSIFLGTVDYLWYSDNLLPTRVLDTPPVEVLRKMGGLPYKNLGSDHLALGSEFAFTQCNREEEYSTKTTTVASIEEDTVRTV